MIKIIDTRGRLCPEPLILTRRAITQGAAGDQFEVLTDNEMACSNLRSYLAELGIAFRVSALAGSAGEAIRFTLASAPLSGGGTRVAASSSAPEICETATSVTPAFPVPVGQKGGTKTGYCVAVAADTMGRGDEALGRILLRAFLNALGEAERMPSHILFYNSGIRMALEGADTVAALRELERRGVGVLVCGTCLDFYEAMDRLAVGRVSNMFKITEILSQADHVVYP